MSDTTTGGSGTAGRSDAGPQSGPATDAETDTESAADLDGETGPKAFRLGPVVGVFALFAMTIAGGLAMVGPFRDAGVQAFENPDALSNVAIIVGEVLVATAVMLLAFRYDRGEALVRLLVLGSVALLVQYPIALVLPATLPAAEWVGLGVGVGLAALLWAYPEWYVIDASAVLFGAAAVALFGASLSPLPVVLLLVVMAVYDAYSVYVSEHMQSLGGGIVGLKLPMVFVVPVERGFSLRAVKDLEDLSESAMLLGLGDAIFPGLLAASGAVFVSAPPVVAGLNLPALGAFAGALLGMVTLEVLLYVVRRAHAGLPALNGGVIAGYLTGAVAAGVPLAEALGIAGYV